MSKKLQKLAPMYFTVPITRVDKETREVEGYAFVNEVVPGEGGIRLTRKAMQAATADYMEWAAVREMHQPSAVGKALEARWDEKGLIIRAKIVDDAAWEKVEEGVYKAYSVGVKARVMRGKDVTVCDHFETSLVDRPKDKDCSLFRIDGDEESDCEVEADDEAPEPVPVERGVFADQMAKNEKATLRYAAVNLLTDLLWTVQNGESAAKEADARAIIAEFADYVCPIIARGEMPDLTRVWDGEDDGDDQSELLTRLEGDVTRLQGELDTAKADLATKISRVAELERMRAPDREAPPVRFPARALDREFLANLNRKEEQQIASLREEAESLMKRAETETIGADERAAMATRISRIKIEAASLGEPLEV